MPKPNLHLITNYRRTKDAFQKGNVFCALDTETTGLSTQTSRLIELSAIKFTKDCILESFSTLINPCCPILEKITDITGIKDADVKNAPIAEKVIPEFKKFCQDTILVAHNAQFDLRFINMESEKLGLEPLTNFAVDTLRLSRILLPENGTWKQAKLAEQFKIRVEHAHRAQDDTRVCMELFKKLIELPLPTKKKRKPKND